MALEDADDRFDGVRNENGEKNGDEDRLGPPQHADDRRRRQNGQRRAAHVEGHS